MKIRSAQWFRHFLMGMILLAAVQALQAQEIKFDTGTWEQISHKAALADKVIFVDMYAVWCGPCKAMAKIVFTQPKVAEHFNAHFINYKVDAEKEEGVSLAEQYGVNSFPTYLFIDSKGKLLHKVIGALPADQFIAESTKAFGK
jgi:thiol:disulfide interchange protein